MSQYRIIRLSAENIKRLTAVEIVPGDKNLIEITGKNGAGKTSVLDAIWWALGGTANVQDQPIRNGEDEAIVELDLGPLIVRRKFIAQEDGSHTTSLTVSNPDGARYQSPQKMLDAILGDLTFDPLAFTRLAAKDQLKSLQTLVADFDFDHVAEQRAEAFTERRDINRDIKSLGSQIDAVAEKVDANEGAEVIDLSAATKAYDEANKLREAFTIASNERQRGLASLENASNRVAEITSQIENLKAERTELTGTIEHLEKNVAKPLGAMPDISAARANLEKAQSQTAIVAAIDEKARLEKRKADLTKQSEALTTKMTDLDQSAADAVRASNIPVHGIAFGADCVMLNGVPFNQGSDAEQLRAAIEIAIAMNPELRICRVRDGSLIDEDGMKALEKYAAEHGFQVWIETVQSDRDTAIVIEDGSIKGGEA